jgi:nicotinamide mononucleotide transporter
MIALASGIAFLTDFAVGFFTFLSRKNSTLVYPTGLITTSIYVYLLFHWRLLGDMLINGYYFLMGIYGWYFWSKKENGITVNKISRVTKFESYVLWIWFFGSLILVNVVYVFFGYWGSIVGHIDAMTTAIFFVAMLLMVRRKIENWIFWIIGDIVSVPLYLYKGLALTALQYFIFTLLAVAGYITWKKELKKNGA